MPSKKLSLIDKLNNGTITYSERLQLIDIIQEMIKTNKRIIEILEKKQKK